MNPFIELIKLKKQELAITTAIKKKEQEAIEWHFSGDDTKKLTGEVAKIDGASVIIKLVRIDGNLNAQIDVLLNEGVA